MAKSVFGDISRTGSYGSSSAMTVGSDRWKTPTFDYPKRTTSPTGPTVPTMGPTAQTPSMPSYPTGQYGSTRGAVPPVSFPGYEQARNVGIERSVPQTRDERFSLPTTPGAPPGSADDAALARRAAMQRAFEQSMRQSQYAMQPQTDWLSQIFGQPGYQAASYTPRAAQEVTLAKRTAPETRTQQGPISYSMRLNPATGKYERVANVQAGMEGAPEMSSRYQAAQDVYTPTSEAYRAVTPQEARAQAAGATQQYAGTTQPGLRDYSAQELVRQGLGTGAWQEGPYEERVDEEAIRSLYEQQREMAQTQASEAAQAQAEILRRQAALRGVRGGVETGAQRAADVELRKALARQMAEIGMAETGTIIEAREREKQRAFAAEQEALKRQFGREERLGAEEVAFARDEAMRKYQAGERMSEQEQQWARDEATRMFTQGQTLNQASMDLLRDDLARRFAREERLGGEQAQQQRDAAMRKFQEGQRLSSQEFEWAGQEAQRKFARGERLSTEEFQLLRDKTRMDFDAEESERARQFAAEEAEAGRAFTSAERIASQVFQGIFAGLQNQLTLGRLDHADMLTRQSESRKLRQNAAYNLGLTGGTLPADATPDMAAAFMSGQAGQSFTDYTRNQTIQDEYRKSLLVAAAQDPEEFNRVRQNIESALKDLGFEKKAATTPKAPTAPTTPRAPTTPPQKTAGDFRTTREQEAFKRAQSGVNLPERMLNKMDPDLRAAYEAGLAARSQSMRFNSETGKYEKA